MGEHLRIDGCDVVELAKRYGTPLWVLSERELIKNYRRILNSFKSRWPKTKIAYAVKANPLSAVCHILKNEGSWIEVVSGGELEHALKIGYRPEEIIFNGNNKGREYLRLAIEKGCLINVDSLHELKIIVEEQPKTDNKARLGLRVNPNVPSGVIDEWATGLKNSKFGLDIISEEAIEALEVALGEQGVEVISLHTHIGSQIEEVLPYDMALQSLIQFIKDAKEKFRWSPNFLSLGGGFPVPFTHHNSLPDIDDFAEVICSRLKSAKKEGQLDDIQLVLEPGGSICGTAFTLLLSVGTIKGRQRDVPWVALDGGANVLLRATQGWYSFPVVCANKIGIEPNYRYNLAGPLCYQGDVLARNVKMPELSEGDIIAFLQAGAYTLAVENTYNYLPRPAVIMVKKDGSHFVVRKRETVSQLSILEIWCE